MTEKKARQIFYNHIGVSFNPAKLGEMARLTRIKLREMWKSPQCSADLNKAVEILMGASQQKTQPMQAVFASAPSKPTPVPTIPRRKP